MEQAYHLAAFEKAWKEVNIEEAKFLRTQREDFAKRKPLRGVRILHGIPCSLEALCKVEALVLGGADVTIRAMKGITPYSQKTAVKLIKEIGLSFIGEDLPQEESFDLYLDCSAEMRHMPPPEMGIVEITQTGSEIYRSNPPACPVVSIDQSKLKLLEDFMGTGEACVRALEKYVAAPLNSLHVLVFGYGKVGAGAVHALKKRKARVAVVEIDSRKLGLARKRADRAFSLTEDEALLRTMQKVDLVLTATGVKGIMSQLFTPDDFRGKILANIGAEDEFGKSFPKERVLNAKQPINFSLDEPTCLRYLDPILFAHNYAAEYLLTQNLPVGFHPFPKQADEEICRCWQESYQESFPSSMEEAQTVSF